MIESRSGQSYQNTQRYLFAVAYRMTGSATDAEDLVHDAWIRYLDAGSPDVSSLRAYLTTVVSRLALDYLKSARVQREQYVGPWMPEPVLTGAAIPGPAESIEQREEVSYALLLLLERLTPEQRVVYVLREGFGLPYDDIAVHVDKSVAACRQTYHRAQRLLAADAQPVIAPIAEHKRLVEAFLGAFSTGNIEAVTRILAEDVVSFGDGGPDRLAARLPIIGRDKVIRGAFAWANKFPDMLPMTYEIVDLNGAPGIVVRVDGIIDRVLQFEVRGGRIATVRTTLNPDKLRHLNQTLPLETANAG